MAPEAKDIVGSNVSSNVETGSRPGRLPAATPKLLTRTRQCVGCLRFATKPLGDKDNYGIRPYGR